VVLARLRTIEDDRGARRRIAAPAEVVGLVRVAEGDGAAAEAYRRLEGGRWFLRAMVAVYGLWLGVKFAANVVSGRVSLVGLGSGVVLLLVLAWFVWRRSHWLMRRPPAEVRAIMLGLGRCPACGYSLRGFVAEGDGATVCAECGGAWRMDARNTDHAEP
jgi:hypothetical protein